MVASATYLVGDALINGIGVLLTPVYTRVMTPTDYGIIAVGTTVVALGTLLLGLSLWAAIGRLHFEARDEHDRRTLYGTVLLFLLTVPLALTLALELAGRAGLLDISESIPYDPYLRLAVWAAYFAIFIQVPISIYVVTEQPRKVIALTVANAVLITGLTLWFVVGWRDGAEGALRALAIASAAMAVVSVALSVRLGSLRFSRRWLRESLRFAAPLIPHSVAQWGLFLADRLILPRFVSSANVGLYSLGGMVGTVSSFGVIAFNRAASPVVLGELKARGREDDYVPRIGTYWLGAMMAVCLAMAVLGDDAIRVIAPSEYHGATVVVPWVVLGFFLMGIYTILVQGTFFSMRTGWVAPITLAAAGVNVGLCFLLIPEYGFEAAAWATAIAFGLLALMHGLLAHRLYPIPWEYSRWAKLIAAGVATYLLAQWVSPSAPLAGAAVGLAASALCLPLALTAARFWSPGELDVLRSRLRLGS
jgi:O-antigen/teichoic acid export membrane protein